ncbi:MAG: N-acetylglucosamine-6-phosphate deacetylase [Chloroflexota bacterium]
MSRLTVRGQLLLGSELVEGMAIVEDGTIVAVERGGGMPSGAGTVIDAPVVAPGFIDLQVNGGFGVEVGDDAEAFRCLARRLPSTGVTAFLPTAVSSPPEFYPGLWRAFHAARNAPGAHMVGLHIEGPFISPQRRGAHREDVIRNADWDLMDTLLQDGLMRIITLAPERPGALARIPRLREAGVVVSLGHTDATQAQCEAGVDAGAAMATHLFNAMSFFHHRAPGAVGWILTDDRVTAGIIADGLHAHPASIDLALRCKGLDRIVLVTDMMAAAGMGPGLYRLGGQTVVVDGESARLQNGTLAGSTITLDAAVRNIVRWTNLGLADALRMVTEVPARTIAFDGGRIVPGSRADLVLLDSDLHVQTTIIGGRVVFQCNGGGQS